MHITTGPVLYVRWPLLLHKDNKGEAEKQNCSFLFSNASPVRSILSILISVLSYHSGYESVDLGPDFKTHACIMIGNNCSISKVKDFFYTAEIHFHNGRLICIYALVRICFYGNS